MKYAQPVGKGCEKILAKPDGIWYPLMARALGTAYQGGPLPQCLRGKNVSCKGRIIMDLIKTLTANYMKPELPQMNVGDTVRVTLRVKEGSRERHLSAAFPTASAARRFSLCILPASSPWRPSGAVKSVGRSCTTCATAWARLRRSRASSTEVRPHRKRTPHRGVLFPYC